MFCGGGGWQADVGPVSALSLEIAHALLAPSEPVSSFVGRALDPTRSQACLKIGGSEACSELRAGPVSLGGFLPRGGNAH